MKTLDIVLLNLHGAMVAVDFPDAEGEVLRALVLVVVSMLAYAAFVRWIEGRPVTDFGRERAVREWAVGVALGFGAITITGTASPIGLSATVRVRSRTLEIILPLKVVMTSPAKSPASLAGPSGTSVISAPCATARFIASATSGVTS